jgi:hypothetical protein
MVISDEKLFVRSEGMLESPTPWTIRRRKFSYDFMIIDAKGVPIATTRNEKVAQFICQVRNEYGQRYWSVGQPVLTREEIA